MRRNRLVFWQGQPSPHQSAYLRALAAQHASVEVICVFLHGLDEDRIRQGWTTPDLSGIATVTAPDASQVAELATAEPHRSVHVIGGLGLPFPAAVVRHGKAAGALIGLMSEARDGRGVPGLLRRLNGICLGLRDRGSIDFVLAMGDLGVRWFGATGFRAETIFPFAYVVEHDGAGSAKELPEPAADAPLRLAFVGQCIPRKGVDLLLRALAGIDSRRWMLEVAGDGAERMKLERLAKRLGFAAQVHFRGAIRNTDVRNLIAASEVLLLPSRFDGWGAVVNEALMHGVPVICSDRCGAADLVYRCGVGSVFEAGSVRSLHGALNDWIPQARFQKTARASLRAWSRVLEGQSMARYLLEVIRYADEGGERPRAPWDRHERVSLRPVLV